MAAIRVRLSERITDYTIPEHVKERFDWLSGGDVSVKEQLLNYFRRMEQELSAQSLQEKLPILQAQMQNNSQSTGLARVTVTVHKHTFEISIDKRLGSEFREGSPDPLTSNSSGSGIGCLVFIVGFALLCLLAAVGHHH
jgi:hypothetical protein